MADTAGRSYAFPRLLRLTRGREFDAVFREGRRKHCGPLVVHARPNGLEHLRLGLSVSRRVGNAVRRGRIKRLLRESFRRIRHDLPGGYDLVVSVRAHTPLTRVEYGELLARSVRALARGDRAES